MEQFTWINPNITHAGLHNLLPLYKGPWPKKLYEDGHWLVLRGVKGFVVCDLWSTCCWETTIQDLDELQIFVTMHPGPL